MRIDWNQFKTFITDRGLTIHENELNDSDLLLEAHDGPVVRECKVKNGTSEHTDYTSNYQSKANIPVGAMQLSGVKDPRSMRARMIGSHYATVAAGTTKNIDWAIPQLSWLGVNKQSYFDGVEYYAGNSTVGDTITFQVVDVDGIAYPAGTVLEEFATNWYVMGDTHSTLILYKAKLVAGMYIRVVYTSTGATNVDFVCNVFRHLDTSVTI